MLVVELTSSEERLFIGCKMLPYYIWADCSREVTNKKRDFGHPRNLGSLPECPVVKNFLSIISNVFPVKNNKILVLTVYII